MARPVHRWTWKIARRSQTRWGCRSHRVTMFICLQSSQWLAHTRQPIRRTDIELLGRLRRVDSNLALELVLGGRTQEKGVPFDDERSSPDRIERLAPLFSGDDHPSALQFRLLGGRVVLRGGGRDTHAHDGAD